MGYDNNLMTLINPLACAAVDNSIVSGTYQVVA